MGDGHSSLSAPGSKQQVEACLIPWGRDNFFRQGEEPGLTSMQISLNHAFEDG